jgi:tRNA/tmRNA/rRNA uracil-C5-methylase (TrmA/RlmC/RlmD family)
VQEGQQIELEIAKVVYRGSGLARLDGMVVFVPGCAPGERIRAEVVRIRKNYAEARLIEVLEASADRTEGCCRLESGVAVPGCVYDHVAYAAEVAIKREQLLEMVRRLPGCSGVVDEDPFASPLPLNYRNKITLHAQRPRGSEAEHSGSAPWLGYFGDDNRTVVDLPQCPLARGPINETLTRFRASEAFRNLKHGESITFRWTSADGVKSWIGEAPSGLMLSEHSPAGALKVPAGAFYQVNPEVGYALARQVAQWFSEGNDGSGDVLDLYCGVGVFGLSCAAGGGVRNLLGVESVASAIEAAEANATALGLASNFQCLTVEKAAQRRFGGIDGSSAMAIVDPPRTGLDIKVAKALVRLGTPRICYVSCDPATLCRDLQVLLAGGYRVSKLRLFDMFPRTAHFETAVELTRS